MKRRKTLYFLFLKQVIGIAAAVILEIILFITIFSIGLNMGIILPANYTENYLRQIEKKIANSEPFSKEILPEICEYALFDFSGNYLEGNFDNIENLTVLFNENNGNIPNDAGSYSHQTVQIAEEWGKRYKVIEWENGYCVIRYSVEAHFSNPTLYRIFPHLEMTAIVLFAMLFLIIVFISALLFGKKLREKLKPLLNEIEQIKNRELMIAYEKSDIREFNEVLSALHEMKEALSDSLKKEWEMEQRRKDNISALAHDIKTPLTIIKGNAELLQEETSIEQICNYAAVINENTDRIEHYIRLLIDETRIGDLRELDKTSIVDNPEDKNTPKGINDLRKLDDEKEISKSETASLSELICDIKAQCEILCDTKKIPIAIKENILCQEDAQIYELENAKDLTCIKDLKKIKDSERILRAVLNIVANAIEYTNPERGIVLYFCKGNERIYINVEDYGKGFSKEALLHATEQFYTEKKERSGGHYGLGLYFAKIVAKEQGGKICIANKADGNGAVVSIEF